MRTLIFLLFPVLCSAQFNSKQDSLVPNLNLPNYHKGKRMEFTAYPLMAGSLFCLGMSDQLNKTDSKEAFRPELFAITGNIGAITSVGIWGYGVSLQGKAKWTHLLKVAGMVGVSIIGYNLGIQTAQTFKPK